jgi:uncharacterized membrane protein YfcA
MTAPERRSPVSVGATADLQGAERREPVLGAAASRVVGTGVSAGVMSGLLGVGGGIVMVPLFVVFWKMPQRVAHATSLFAIIPISIAGILVYGSAGKIHFGEGIPLALGAIIGARIGSGALARFDERLLKVAFAALLLVSAILLTVR